MFMQCFQGHYRDRTEGGRECRYFAAVYPAFRIAAYVIYSVILGRTTSVFFIFLCVLVTLAIVFVSPYKTQHEKFHKLDVAMILSLVALFSGFLFNASAVNKRQYPINIGSIFSVLLSFVPLVYFTIKISLSIKRVLVQKMSAWHCMSCPPSRRQSGDYENLNSINIV